MLGFMWSGMDVRPSISNLCNEYHITPRLLSILADMPEQTIRDMLLLKPACKEDAREILAELSLLLEIECTFENVYIPLERTQ